MTTLSRSGHVSADETDGDFNRTAPPSPRRLTRVWQSSLQSFTSPFRNWSSPVSVTLEGDMKAKMRSKGCAAVAAACLYMLALAGSAFPQQGGEPDTDLPGFDYRSFDLEPPTSPGVCFLACQEDDRCQAWTYVWGSAPRKPRCWLKNTVPRPVRNTCCMSGIRQPTWGYDRPGSDYRNFETGPDHSACEAVCRYDDRCRAWTWVRPGVQGPRARCWLKATIPVRRENPCCRSGMRPVVEKGTNRPGGDYAVFTLTEPESASAVCHVACRQDPQCRAWTFVRRGIQGPLPRCWLKNTVPSARHDTCCDSGIKFGP